MREDLNPKVFDLVKAAYVAGKYKLADYIFNSPRATLPASLEQAEAEMLSDSFQERGDVVKVSDEQSQPDLIKETRILIASLCEATDEELHSAVARFVEGTKRLIIDESLKPTVRCMGASSE